MALLNQFQQYSQGENTITNNVLLMLSNLYEINPRYYEELISAIIEDANSYECIPKFEQQIGNRGDGIIDGCIEVKASKIVVETKIHSKELIDKLVKYGKSFDENSVNILLHLSTACFGEDEVVEIVNKLESLFPNAKASFYSITYQDLVDQLTSLKNTYPHEHHLVRLHDHFEKYCENMNLKPKSQHLLRAMACGQSIGLNIKHQFYFDLASRGFRDFDYLGIYGNKAIRGIGKIDNIIDADFDKESESLTIINSRETVTDDQKKRLITALKESIESGWKIADNHKFFILKDFHELYFQKVSPSGMMRSKYFDLEDYLNPVPADIKTLCEELSKQTWT